MVALHHVLEKVLRNTYPYSDFMSVGWSHINLFDSQGFTGFPGYSSLALDDLKWKRKISHFKCVQ